MTEHYRLLWCIVIEILLKCKALDLDIIICPMPGIKINVGQPAYYSFPALLAGFVLFKTCKFFRNKEQKWQFFPQIKNIWLHFSLWHSLPQAHKLLLNLSISSWVWVVRSYNLNSPYKSSENVREVEFVGQQYKLYQLH